MKNRHVSLLLVGLSLLVLLDHDFKGANAGNSLQLSLFNAGFQRFVDELPIPPVIKPDSEDITITMKQFTGKLHRDLADTVQWGYNGVSPGPTIEVERGQHVRVHWKSELPTTHILAAPKGMDMGGGGEPLPDVRNVVHLHGALVTQTSKTDKLHDNDGWPDAWLVPGEEQIAEYGNDQSARLLWYHDHAMGETGRNVATGLAGMYIIRDEFERGLNLPSGKYEIPLLITAKGVDGNSALYYTPTLANEFYGNAMSVNGKLWPYLNVEPRKYRFRIVNASNARSYSMQLVDLENQSPAPPFYQIGTDSGFLENTVVLNDPADPKSPELTLAPAERADIIIDFSQYAGKTYILHNNYVDQADHQLPMPQLMQFRVGTTVSEPDTSSLPMKLRSIPRMDPTRADGTRQITLNQVDMPDGTPMLLLNGMGWKEEITEKPVLGTTEVWEIVNTTTDVHPFHIHLVEFQVLDRRPFDVDAFAKTGQINYTGPAVAPDANEMGWKDTVRTTGNAVTRIIMKFAPYAGYYVYHCHILEHEDMDMMRPFEIVAP